MAGLLSKFPRNPANAKGEFQDWDNAVIALATRLKIEGFVLTRAQYELARGVDGAFVPYPEPLLPGADATALQYTA